MNFFFREQSLNAIEELFKRAKRDGGELEEIIEDYVDSNDIDIDCLEEMFYDMDIDELAEEFGIELDDEEETEEDE
ncbi:MAG: hypothetical protein ACI4TK_17390 [Agathobacter sp.]